MEVILHIGFPKTGTSAIQSHIFSNQHWFRTQGVYLPAAGYASGLGHAFLLGDDNRTTIAESGYYGLRGEGALTQLSQELEVAERRGLQRALISWEGLALLEEQAISALKEALQDHRVTLLAYVREQAGLYQSSILQSIEHLTSLSATALFAADGAPIATPPYLDFDAVLSAWKRVFANQIKIKVRNYDRDCLVDSNVVLDFLAWLGLNADDRFALEAANVNPSLDSRSAALLVTAQTSGLGYQGLLALSKSLSRFVSDYGTGAKRFLSEAQEEAIRERYRASNIRLFEKFRPENGADEVKGFPARANPAARTDSALTFSDLQRIHGLLAAPARATWLGGPLVARNVARVACPPNRGWRGPEKTGVWSVGARSELAFQLPLTHPVHGPTAIRLTIAGSYYGRNAETVVTFNGRSRRLSLEQAKLSVEIDTKIRHGAVTLVLEHMFPEDPNDGAGAPAQRGIAFRLEFLSYQFVWTHDEEQ